MPCPRCQMENPPQASSVWSARPFPLVPAQSVEPSMRFCLEQEEAELRGLA